MLKATPTVTWCWRARGGNRTTGQLSKTQLARLHLILSYNDYNDHVQWLKCNGTQGRLHLILSYNDYNDHIQWLKCNGTQGRLHLILSYNDYNDHVQWLKCNGTQGNAVPPPPVYRSKRSPTSACYNAGERHTTIVRGPNLNVAFPHL